MMRVVRSLTCALVLGLGPAGASAAAQETRSLDVHFVPTPMPVVETMLSVAQVGKNDVIYDLGSGDGRLVITAAKRHGARAIGVDLDPDRIKESRNNADTAGVADEVRFIEGDLFETDLSDATVVTLYLLSTLNERLRPKLFEELRPGSRVVSHAFDMGDWKPDSSLQVKDAYYANVYYWIIPADVAGEWTLTLPGSDSTTSHTLRLDQKYQEVRGALAGQGSSQPIDSIRLRGDSITIVLPSTTSGGEPMRLVGTVDGDTMTGAVAGERDRRWRAQRN